MLSRDTRDLSIFVTNVCDQYSKDKRKLLTNTLLMTTSVSSCEFQSSQGSSGAFPVPITPPCPCWEALPRPMLISMPPLGRRLHLGGSFISFLILGWLATGLPSLSNIERGATMLSSCLMGRIPPSVFECMSLGRLGLLLLIWTGGRALSGITVVWYPGVNVSRYLSPIVRGGVGGSQMSSSFSVSCRVTGIHIWNWRIHKLRINKK